jgi:uncharacterized protein YodC (DUF2158 family)
MAKATKTAFVLLKGGLLEDDMHGDTNMAFKKGDLVILRSGGPEMTVREVARPAFGKQMVSCVWFSRGKKVEASFDVEVLKMQQQ